MGYSQNKIIAPSLPFDRLQTLQSYNTSSCDSSKPISRYFKTGMALKRLGIEWCDTAELPSFRGGGDLYGGQLPADAGSSTNVKVIRST